MTKTIVALLTALCLCLSMVPALAEDAAGEEEKALFGPFEAENLNGDGPVTEAIYGEADITLVNFWATWCGPCIGELPDLAQISEATEGRVQVVSVLLDAMSELGKRDEDAIEAMRLLAEDAGVTYAVLYPDNFLMAVAGALVPVIPTTFIVDRDGNVYSRKIEGSNKLEGWLTIVQEAADEIYGDEAVILTAEEA